MSQKIISFVFLFLSASIAQAQNVAFDQLTDAQAKNVIKEFSANFTHTSVSGASPLGDVFGLEFGLVAGITQTDEINKLAKQADPGAEADKAPHGGILGIVSVPFGFTIEASMIPEVGGDDFKFKNMGLAGKWTINSVVELPVSVALKAHFMKSELNFRQTVSSVTSTVNFEDKVSGLLLLVSKDFVVVEPYLGFGLLKGDGEFSVQGTTQFFQSGVTNYSAKENGTQLVAGIEANLLILKLGAEYTRNFDTSGFNFKLALSF
ncbi:MAG: DUF6588 family protein [Bdellovibrionales bacterium]